MNDETRLRVENLFHACRERQPGPEREAWLDGACGADAELRSRVEALLAANDEAEGFLERPAVERELEGPGSSIGPYKLLQEIGEGGMGVVYMAEQSRPVARKVALKVIKLGMDTRQVIARFEAERQALAMMDHPNIARVLDAGATETGRPYFVMELVRGVAIHEYCDTHKLDTRERLRLFVDVCRAVQHAHLKGVIHRDLKPSNVLVTSHDGRPVPKIIDFGVAKATNQRLTERTLFTEFRQIIGTPEYMSPEQAEMSGLDVDTRSDIYSLGVLLYQLLTGTTPVDPTELRTAGFEEMTRMIREEEPQTPSTRVSKLGAAAGEIARRRGSDAGSLSRVLRGDLDWIVMKALEKDRTRRYETASAFAEDVVRHLQDRPVEAGRPGTLYRLGKFAHRNRRGVAAALVLVLAVALGLAGTTAGFLRARDEAARSRAVSDSLQDVLAMTDSRESGGGDVGAVLETVREVFGSEHATLAAVLDTLALRLRDAGDFESSLELSREALAVWRRALGDDHPNVALTRSRLGYLLRMQGAEEEAEEMLRGALEVLESSSYETSLATHEARVELADLLASRGDYEEADELLGVAVERLRASPSPSRYRILETLERRVVVQINRPGADARETLRAVYDETHAFYPEDSPLLAISAFGLGNHLYQRGDEEAAEPYLREAIRRLASSKREGCSYALAAHDALFQIVRKRNDPESVVEADDLHRRTIDLAKRHWSSEHLVANLGFYANRMVERELPFPAFEAIREAHQALLDEGRPLPERRDVRNGLALVAFKVVARADLEPEAYELVRSTVEDLLSEDPEHPALLTVLAMACLRTGEAELAAETLELVEGSLDDSPRPLAGRLAAADHACRALVHARLGDGDLARDELSLLRAGLPGAKGNLVGDLRALQAETASVLEHGPSTMTSR